MRPGEIVQAAKVQNRDARSDRRLGIRSKKGARLGRVRVRPHSHLQGALNVRDGCADFQKHPVGMTGDDGEAVAGRERDDSLIILLGGAEPGVELFWREVVVIQRAGGIVKLFEQICERVPVVQWKVDGQLQPGRTVQAA